ncbi:hypothetical protein Cpar_0123 [Chlorobaculum parvum NCIB 8327]|uniref:Uncharacterized protein n=1 Tax=Chlorobaculum parvum (strain DSM 263 / NCIMB 8327) TaxID=517417 RepID=B3QRM9_CHLP8|nr:hypothetical protein [Chlorobaculum parvum]ACF10551.1 hypothetical protein Cpar_0123 [Chlorobaculum parvum NCIB 8327]
MVKDVRILEKVTKYFVSVFFRLILVFYGAALLMLYGYVFDWYYYLYFLAFYVFIFIKSSGRQDQFRSHLRLLNDYLLIFLVLYGRNMELPVNYVYAVMPVINSVNHSGRFRNPLLYVYNFFFLLLLFYVNNCEIAFTRLGFTSIILSYLALVILAEMSVLRSIERDFIDDFVEVAEGFALRSYIGKSSIQIYSELMQKINNSPLRYVLKMRAIYCFYLKEQDFIFLNASKLVSDIKFDNPDKVLASLEDPFPVSFDHPVSINGELCANNSVFLSAIHDKKYIFLILLDYKYAFKVLRPVVLYSLLRPVLDRAINYIDLNREISIMRVDMMKKVADKYSYVMTAIKSMHSIRQRLSPIKTI